MLELDKKRGFKNYINKSMNFLKRRGTVQAIAVGDIFAQDQFSVDIETADLERIE